MEDLNISDDEYKIIIGDKVNNIENKFNNIENKFNNIENKFNNIDFRVKTVNNKIININNKLTHINKLKNIYENKIEELEQIKEEFVKLSIKANGDRQMTISYVHNYVTITFVIFFMIERVFSFF
jgi:chromosome segregation ATPase